MSEALLHVLTFTLSDMQAVSDALRMLRRLVPRNSGDTCAFLLFADLPDADSLRRPQDAPLIRSLQSGVMSMNRHSPGRFSLLVRSRTWDDCARRYLGAGQRLSFRQVIADLILSGHTDAAFEAATVTPASLQGRNCAVLFSDLTLACTPDTPLRMLAALGNSPQGMLCARVIHPRSFPETALDRLMRTAEFSLSPVVAMHSCALLLRGHGPISAPLLCAKSALPALASAACAPLAPDCHFIRRQHADIFRLFSRYRTLCLHHGGGHACLPLAEFLLFLAAGAAGSAPLAALALLLAEGWALVHVRQLPGALLRTALLPMTAFAALDALLSRLFQRARYLRLYVPRSLIGSFGCALAGAALLSAALSSHQALAALLPAALLWLAAPLILPALNAPTPERIPLSQQEREDLRAQAQSAFFSLESQSGDPSAAMQMLCACGGCMLGLLEPDEAARRVQALLPSAQASGCTDAACMLCAAQYLCERMADCDAALRELPRQLEALVLAQFAGGGPSPLGRLLSAACGADSQTDEQAHASDALFLPLQSVRAAAKHALTLPFTHPHTYLRMQLSFPDPPADNALFFLSLCAAAMEHPFFSLLERSPVTGAWTPFVSAASS